MVATYGTISTTGRAWWDATATDTITDQLDEQIKLWLGEVCNPVLDAATLVGGSGYTDGTYSNVELIRSTNQLNGKNLEADVTVSSGAVSAVTITQKGHGFKTGDTLVVSSTAQVGGTGSGFSIDLASADASLCLIKSPDDSSSSTSRHGWSFGHGRGATNATYGSQWYLSSDTSSQFYHTHFYNWSDSTSNNNFGTYTNNSTENHDGWYEGIGDGRFFEYAWEADEANNNSYFVFSDSYYKHTKGLIKLVRDPAQTFPPEASLSKWATIGGDINQLEQSAVYNGPQNDAFIGSRWHGVLHPEDNNALMRGFSVYCRSIFAGQWPTNVALGNHYGGSLGSILSNGTEQWRKISDFLWVKVAN